MPVCKQETVVVICSHTSVRGKKEPGHTHTHYTHYTTHTPVVHPPLYPLSPLSVGASGVHAPLEQQKAPD